MNRTAFLILPLVALVSCAREPARVDLSIRQTKISPGQYFRVLKRWTRAHKVIRKFDTTLDVHAVLMSWEFRWAYTVRFAHLYDLTEVKKQQFWATQRSLLDKYVEFVVSASCAEYEWNDLDKGNLRLGDSAPGEEQKGSIWRVTLQVDDRPPLPPVEIRAIEPITELHRSFFPFIGHFHRLYRIRFPAKNPDGTRVLNDDTQVVKLIFAGPLGRARLEWKTTKAPLEE